MRCQDDVKKSEERAGDASSYILSVTSPALPGFIYAARLFCYAEAAAQLAAVTPCFFRV